MGQPQCPRVQDSQGHVQRGYGWEKWGMEGLKLGAVGDRFKRHAAWCVEVVSEAWREYVFA